MTNHTLTIDSQVHCYERNHAARPWHGTLEGPEEVTGDDMVAAMDSVGVDGAILISPFAMYQYDASYALQVYDEYPGKFGLVRPFNPDSESIAEEMAAWAATPGVVGARIMLISYDYGADHPGLNAILDSGGREGLPINIMASGALPTLIELARRNPDTQVIIDHVGLAQPFVPPAPPKPFEDLPLVLAAAELDNIAIKISGACTLSHKPFPYEDIWDPLSRVFEAYGLERCLWGTDWTRAVRVLTYEQGVESFRITDRLSDSDRATLMGGSLSKIYGWSPSNPT